MKRLQWALVAALPLTACGFDTDLSVSAPDDLVEQTSVAIDAWNDALAVGPCYGVNLKLVADGDADIVIVWDDAGGARGFTFKRRIEINPKRDLPSERYPWLRTTTIAHEIGHALGAQHSQLRADLMWADTPPERGPQPTGYDVARVCQYVFGARP